MKVGTLRASRKLKGLQRTRTHRMSCTHSVACFLLEGQIIFANPQKSAVGFVQGPPASCFLLALKSRPLAGMLPMVLSCDL